MRERRRCRHSVSICDTDDVAMSHRPPPLRSRAGPASSQLFTRTRHFIRPIPTTTMTLNTLQQRDLYGDVKSENAEAMLAETLRIHDGKLVRFRLPLNTLTTSHKVEYSPIKSCRHFQRRVYTAQAHYTIQYDTIRCGNAYRIFAEAGSHLV